MAKRRTSRFRQEAEAPKKPEIPLAEKLKKAAEVYVARGWHVLPVNGDKSPQTEHGFKDASLDPGDFNWNSAEGIAVATGPSGILVVDVDSEAANAAYLKRLDGDSGTRLIAKTPRGWHYVYLDPERKFKSGKSPWTDVDTKAAGGYVLVPYGDASRRWISTKFPPPLPPPLVERALLNSHASTAPEGGGGWSELPILERFGWVRCGGSEDNTYYRRPGKTEGKSGTWNGALFYCHSSNAPPFEEGEGYNRAQVKYLLLGPDSKWRREKLVEYWAHRELDSELQKFFNVLAGATKLIQDKYRLEWQAWGRRVKSFDDILKESRGMLKKAEDAEEPNGQLLQKEYPPLLAKLGYEVRLNECNQDIEINDEYWDEMSIYNLLYAARVWAQERGRAIRDELMITALYVVAKENAYNPLKEYLEGLPESTGTVEMDKFIACFVSDDPDDQDGVAARIKSWLVGCVARVYNPAYQNPMLVLQGGQGIGKSEVARWLCLDILGYANNSPVNPDDKDDCIKQSRTWIWEVEDLEATTSLRVMTKLKSFLTKTQTRLRAPYGKRDMVRTTIANYLGTVNPRVFLTDETGNRRFLVCFLDRIDWSYSGQGVGGPGGEVYDPGAATTPGGVWADAMRLYKQDKEAWRLTREQKMAAESDASQALDTSDVDAELLKVLELTDNEQDIVWLDDIVSDLRAEGIKVASSGRLRRGICSALKKVHRLRERKSRPVSEGGQGGKNKKTYFRGVRRAGFVSGARRMAEDIQVAATANEG